jgi:hypothetical protein
MSEPLQVEQFMLIKKSVLAYDTCGTKNLKLIAHLFNDKIQLNTCGLYCKSFRIIIYNHHGSGLDYKTTITIVIYDPIKG